MNYYGIHETGFAMRLGKHECPEDAERAAIRMYGPRVSVIINERQAKILIGSLVTKMRNEQKYSTESH